MEVLAVPARALMLALAVPAALLPVPMPVLMLRRRPETPRLSSLSL